jgi:hypothetical protein
MAVSRLSQQSIQQAFPKGNTVWDGTTATSAFDSLGAVLLTSNTASITFSSIPQTYTHLQIRGTVKANRATYVDDLGMRFNGDSTSNYSYHRLYSFGSGTPGSDAGTSSSSMNIGQVSGGTVNNSNTFGVVIIDILNYASTTITKTVRCLTGADDNGQGGVQLGSGNWRTSNTGVSIITLLPLIGSVFFTNTQVALYGIK